MNSNEYLQYDMTGLAALVAAGETTPDELLDIALEHTRQSHAALNAVNLVAEEHARQAIANGLPDGLFKGVPYLLKDLYQLCTGLPTSNGSVGMALPAAGHDSTLTERYKAAGLVIFGKTNSPEMGLNASTESAALGPCRNPYDLDRSAGGSSGGAAAAVAAGILPGAHATDGGGSIRIPASNCGLFGFKPTRARNPAGPDVGEGWSGLSVGHAVTRSVRDSAALLDATAGPAVGDPYAAPPVEGSFASHAGREPKVLKVALYTRGKDCGPTDPECVRAAENTARSLQDLGHHVEECQPPLDAGRVINIFNIVMSCNVAAGIDAVGNAKGTPLTADDVEAVTWDFAERGWAMSGRDYAGTITDIHLAGREMGAFFQRYDVLLSPTLANPPLPLGTLETITSSAGAHHERLFAAIPFTPIFNLSGGPAVTLPLHWTDSGLPVGVHIGANQGREDLLLQLSSQLETTHPWFDRLPAMTTSAR